jgi:ATP-binding cassette subfamily B (MDR/TAP) protein 1
VLHRWFDLDANSSGKLASYLATDASYIRGAVGDAAALAFQNLATMACGYVIAFIYDWRMALVVTGVAPLVAVGGYLNLKYTVGFSKGADQLYSDANHAVSEAVASIRVIQAYRLEGYVAGLYRRMLHGTNVEGRKSAMVGGAGFAYSMFVMFGMYSLVVWFGGLEVISCRATFQQFLTAFM